MDLREELYKTISKFIKLVKKGEDVNFISYMPQSVDVLKSNEKYFFNYTEKNIFITDFKSNESYTISPVSWKRHMNKFMNMTKNAIFIFENINMSDEELAEVMQKSRDYYPLIVFASNSLVKAEKYTGWTAKIYANFTFFVNRNLKNFDSFKYQDWNGKLDIGTLSSGKLESKKGQEISMKIINKPLVKPTKDNSNIFEIFNILPEPTIRPDPKNSLWLQEFYTYLKTLIMMILPEGKGNLLKYVLNDTTLKSIWIPAFTHRLYNPNDGENYEFFETLGDQMQYYVFSIYINKKYPQFAAKDKFTNLKQHILSTEFQGKWGKEMKLNKWVIMPEKMYPILEDNIKLAEDLNESFCGALDQAFYKNLSLGFGSMCVYNLFSLVFDNYNFPENAEPPKTQIGQLIEKINTNRVYAEKKIVIPKPNEVPENVWDEILTYARNVFKEKGINEEIVSKLEKKDIGFKEVIEKNEQGQIVTKIYLKKSGANILREKGINIKNDILLGMSVDATKGPGSKKAYANALKKLKEYGIDQDWINTKNVEKNISNLEFLDQVLLKARTINNKIVKIDIKDVENLKRDKVFQIIGIDDKGKRYSIHSYIPEQKQGNIKQQAINDFLEI